MAKMKWVAIVSLVFFFGQSARGENCFEMYEEAPKNFAVKKVESTVFENEFLKEIRTQDFDRGVVIRRMSSSSPRLMILIIVPHNFRRG
jgi:hypothetical protein